MSPTPVYKHRYGFSSSRERWRTPMAIVTAALAIALVGAALGVCAVSSLFQGAFP